MTDKKPQEDNTKNRRFLRGKVTATAVSAEQIAKEKAEQEAAKEQEE